MWTEPTEEEFEKRRKTENFYKIFYVNDKQEKITVDKFWAKDDKCALDYLHNYCDEHQDRNYYFTSSGYYLSGGKRYDSFEESFNDEGRKHEYDTDSRKYDIDRINGNIETLHKYNKDGLIEKTKNFLKARLKEIEDYEVRSKSVEHKVSLFDLNEAPEDKMDELVDETESVNSDVFKIRDLEYLNRTKHRYNESWSIDSHMLEDLEFNIPILIKDKQGVPTEYCEKARDIIHKDDKNYNRNEVNKNDPNYDENGVMELASKLWNDDLEKLLLNVKLYQYYENFGIVDEKNPEEVEFDKKYHSTIPLIQGSYDDIDYVKLSEISNNCWNYIWDFMKEHGRDLWD